MNISNELGNIKCATGFPSWGQIIGHVLLSDNSVVLFVFNPDPDRPYHEIGLYNPSACLYRTLLKGQCLNFAAENPVNALYRIKNGCERIVYFTDYANPYRTFNLDKLPEYCASCPTIAGDGCDRMKFSRDTLNPGVINAIVKDSSGQLELGTYNFAVRYLDNDYNPTD